MTLEEAYGAWADELVRYGAVLVGPHDAADLVADTFAQLLVGPSAGWSGARDARRYLFGAVANRARMAHRSAGRQRDREQRHMALVSADASADIAPLATDGRVERAMADLSTQQRAITYLAYWEDLTATEIASLLGVSEGTVRKQLARARARMREVLS